MTGINTDYTQVFGYDDAGNPTTFKGVTGGFNADNQQTSPGTFAYDGNGNPTTYKGASLTFDVENRMTSVQVGINAQSNGYRSDGLRAWKGWNVVLPQGENDAVAPGTYFYYDGGFPALETNSSGTVTAINVFAPDGLVARKVSGAWRHYQFDAQGSVMHRLRDDETVINNSKYDAYGMHVSMPFPVADAFGYNGRWGYYTDDETGLILCMHRYYDAAAGRWLTRDPIGYEGGVNLYGYCYALPVGLIDPSGLDAFQNISDVAAGCGDTLTFGATKWGRRLVGNALGVGDANQSVNYDSGFYTGGQVIGIAHAFLLGKALGAPAAGKEFSHMIPIRILKTFNSPLAKLAQCKVWWNGNYVTPRLHSMIDPYRYLKGQTKWNKGTLPGIVRWPLRVPFRISLPGATTGYSLGGRE